MTSCALGAELHYCRDGLTISRHSSEIATCQTRHGSAWSNSGQKGQIQNFELQILECVPHCMQYDARVDIEESGGSR